jgi:deoxyribose-phosphate aldolase
MSELAKHIEHTLLKPDCTQKEVQRLCEEVVQHGFAGACIPPLFVRDARRIFGDNPNAPRVVTVVGFPMGYSAIAAKSEEIRRAIDEGADEIDAVANIAAMKSEQWNHVEHDIDGIYRAVNMRGKTVKIILECGLLTVSEIQKAMGILQAMKVPYVKTSTGLFGHPATVEMVRQLRNLAQNGLKIKAAGGIRTAQLAKSLLEAGADRIGTSASLELIGIKKSAATP